MNIEKLDGMSYDKLIGYAEEVNRAVRRKAYAEGYAQGKFDEAISGEYLGEKMRETPQEERDRIVEQAKADIAELKVKEDPYDGEYYRVTTGESNLVCRAEFVVNSDKRTVVALMRGYSSGNVRAKGIAKCAPDDCFNVHIGKAIAIRRALGLDVPDEYIYAPQPTVARVGDNVRGRSGEKFVITKREREYDGIYGKAYRIEESLGWLGDEQFRIIDDSRDGTANERT